MTGGASFWRIAKPFGKCAYAKKTGPVAPTPSLPYIVLGWMDLISFGYWVEKCTALAVSEHSFVGADGPKNA